MAINSIDKKIGKKLKKVREDAGFSQGEFGLKVGLTCESPAPVVSNYELGKRGMDIEFLAKLYDFGVDLNWFVGGTGGESATRKNNVNFLERACCDTEKVQLDLLYGSKNKPLRDDLEAAFKKCFLSLVDVYSSSETTTMVNAMEKHFEATKPLRELF
jgi:transcriptional regulator with XRE-family HTH domain